MLQICCLGAPQLTLSTAAFQPTLTPKALALFVYLAVTQQAHSRDQLADLLWSETNNQQARANLRYLLPEVRQPLGDYLVITSQTIAFQRQAPYWLDVEQLRITLMAHPETITTPALQAALDLYQAEFLTGFSVRSAPVFEAWMTRQREDLHTLVVQSSYTLAERYWQQAAYQPGLAATQRLLQWDLWHEAGHRLQMRLLVASGQRTAALAHYAHCRQLLADDLNTEPEPATTALYEQIRSGAYDKVTDASITLPPPHPVTLSSAPPHNLPGQLTSFVGREREVTELCAKVLSSDWRLLTLVGAGGSGKTRLALAVAQAIVTLQGKPLPATTTAPALSTATIHHPPFPDGVWFVPLVDLPAAGDASNALAAAVGEALGLRFAGSERLDQQVYAQLRARRLLLVLDNFEHLAAETDFVLGLLRAVPAVKLLVTSRQWLNVQTEFLWPVAGLQTPTRDEAAQLPVTALACYESVALFCLRAQARERTFHLNAANCTAVVQICQRVEGLPLALELAAGLIRRYDCAAIGELLQADYTILTADQHDLPARHRSLQAVLAASWGLLSATDAQILAQCAVFCGGFSRTAVQAVTGASLLQLEALESKSLLHQLRPGRYTIHELVRQYSATQLQSDPSLHAQARARHGTYYLALLQAQGERLHIDVEAQQQIRLEHDNILAAWQYFVATPHLPTLRAGLPALVRFYRLAGYYATGLALCQQAVVCLQTVAASDATLQPSALRILAQLLLAQAEFCHNLGRLPEASQLITQVLTVGRQLGDDLVIAQAQYEKAEVARLNDQFDVAQKAIRQASTLTHKRKQVALEAACLNRHGVILISMADFAGALTSFQAALPLLQVAPDQVLEARLLLNLGLINYWQRQLSAALAYNQRARDLTQHYGDQRGYGLAFVQLGFVWQTIGEFAEAQASYQQAQAIFHNANMAYFEGMVLTNLGYLWYEQGDYRAAGHCYEEALQIAQCVNSPILSYWVHTNLGYLLIALQQFDEAAIAYQHAITLLRAGDQRNKSMDAYAGRVALLLAQNRNDQALVQVEAILPNLQIPQFNATFNQNLVYWVCYTVLKAAGDRRSQMLLQRAYQALQKQAATLDQQSLQLAFWHKVPVNRLLMTEAQATGIA